MPIDSYVHVKRDPINVNNALSNVENKKTNIIKNNLNKLRRTLIFNNILINQLLFYKLKYELLFSDIIGVPVIKDNDLDSDSEHGSVSGSDISGSDLSDNEGHTMNGGKWINLLLS